MFAKYAYKSGQGQNQIANG